MRTEWIRNLVVFAAAILIGTPVGGYINGSFALTGYVGTAIVLAADFVVYVFLARWFKARPEL